MEDQKMRVDFGFATICVQAYDVDGVNNEIVIYVEGKDGLVEQDLALVTKAFKNNDWVTPLEDYVDIRIWGDSDSEDYTDKFRVAMYKGDELL